MEKRFLNYYVLNVIYITLNGMYIFNRKADFLQENGDLKRLKKKNWRGRN